MTEKKLQSIFFAVLAAVFYAVNVPFSKQLLQDVPPTFMASFLYFGAGIGVGIMYLFHWSNEQKEERLTKDNLPYTIGMVLLDIFAPIFLMLGVSIGSSANASLLGNFEIVATTLIALLIFKETVSKRLWTAILFITISSIILSFEGSGSFHFSLGSLFVLLATICWGMENNCTRKISEKSTYQIVTIKGLCCGLGSFVVASAVGESLPSARYIIFAMLLGFIAYGLSIFLYIRAQRDLGAAKTSAYYAVAPFIGTFLAFVINGEQLSVAYLLGLFFMIIGTLFVVADTLVKNHSHLHTHLITHTHDGSTHTHVITHEHGHEHFCSTDIHKHHHHNLLMEKHIH
nr:DMT family transporter [uncultured Anaerobutyricum sp.]